MAAERSVVPEPICRNAIEWKVSLRSLQQAAIRHNPRMAGCAGQTAQFDLFLLPDHVTIDGHDAVSGHGNSSCFVPSWIAHLRRRLRKVENARGIKNNFSRLDPVRFGLQRRPMRVVPDGRGFLTPEPLHIPRRLVAGRIDGVALVDGPNRNTVIVLGGGVPGRASRTGRHHLECGHRLVVPQVRHRRNESVVRRLCDALGSALRSRN